MIHNFKNQLSELNTNLNDTKLKNNEKFNETLNRLKEENSEIKSRLDQSESEKKELEASLKSLMNENEILQTRKDLAAGENLQLMLEVDNQSKQFQSMADEIKAANQRIKYLEKENKDLTSHLTVAEASKTDKLLAERAAEKAAELESKNRDLLEWRNQLSEKNKNLTAENNKLKSKCASLEDLLNEESADINEVLELIKNLQTQASNHNCAIPGSVIGPIAKFRDLKLNPH